MSEPPKNYDKIIQSYILTDVLKEVSIDESYENMCKNNGKDAIAFYDFQYWFYRFKDGKLDLNFDRSSEPEPLQFSDLPLDAVKLIVDKLEGVERLVLRHVSKSFRNFAEKQHGNCDSIAVFCGSDCVEVCFYDSMGITYARQNTAFKKSLCSTCTHHHFTILGDSYESEAFNDMEWFLKNPMLQLSLFSFTYVIRDQKKSDEEVEMIERCNKRMESFLKSLKHQVCVHQFAIDADSPDDLLAILPYLKPGYLESMLVEQNGRFSSWNEAENAQKIQQIKSLDQWKQAKRLELNFLLKFFPDNALTHFRGLCVREKDHQPGVMSRLKNICINSVTLEDCHLDRENILKKEDLEIGVRGPPNLFASNVRHYMIPNSNQYLEFEYMDNKSGVTIKKKNRQ